MQVTSPARCRVDSVEVVCNLCAGCEPVLLFGAMSQDLQERIAAKSRPVQFRATRGLVGSVTLGVGALMGAGLYVLVGIAAKAAGPSMWAAYAVCGVLTLLSVQMYSDFARRMPISGGGYVYAYRQLGSFWGFMVGWHLAVGSVFACALYAFGFAFYGGSFFPKGAVSPWMIKAAASVLVVVLVALALRGGPKDGGGGGGGVDWLQRILTWGNLLVLVVLVIVALPLARASRFSPALPNGIGGVGAAISLIYISFFGYQLIANSAEEVHDARRTVPRAMVVSMVIALVFYIVVSLVAVATVDWRDLANSKAPLVLMASRSIGVYGAVLIGVGAVLASAAALNSTLVSQGRQIYAMGRDRLLPWQLGTVKETSQVPVVALVSGGVLTVLVVVLADLAFIAKAANFALLFSMLPISVALHRLYQVRADTDPVVSLWRRAVPWAALVANAGLLLTLDWQSLLFGGAVVGAGCAVFLSYSYSAEKRGQAGFSVSLNDDSSAPLLRRGERILVPMANPRTQESLLSISEALLPAGGGEIVVLNVVLAGEGQSPRDALRRPSGLYEAVDVMERADEIAERRGVTLRPVVRGARSLPEGIRDAAVEEKCQLIVMGWATQGDARPSALLEEVVQKVRTDLILLQLTQDRPPQKIGVSLGGGGINLGLMVRVGSTLAEQYGGEVTYVNVMPEYYEHEHLRHARQVQIEAITRHTSLVPYRTELLRSNNPLGAIVERTKDLDLLVVGSARGGAVASSAVGSFSELVAQQAHCSVVIVRSASPFERMIPAQVNALRDLSNGTSSNGATPDDTDDPHE
jgi:amino acid transporter